MKREELKDMVDRKDIYDAAREDTLRSMLSDFYGRQMRSTAVLVWVNFLVWAALAAGSVAMLFRAEDIRYQLLYAALFVCFLQWASLTKIFAWQVMNRSSIKREIKRLELRIAEVQDTLRARSS
jgi:hypothetical protein